MKIQLIGMAALLLWSCNKKLPEISITTDKQIVAPGDTVTISCRAEDNRHLESVQVDSYLSKPSSEQMYLERIYFDKSGTNPTTLELSYVVPAQMPQYPHAPLETGDRIELHLIARDKKSSSLHFRLLTVQE